MTMRRALSLLTLGLISAFALIPMGANASPSFYQTPLFGISTVPGGRLLVADSGQGIVNADDGSLVAALPGVTDVAPRRFGGLWASVSGEEPGSQALYRVKPSGSSVKVADLGAFEEMKNPHPAAVESNPFDVADLGWGDAAVADAAGNDLLRVTWDGKVQVIAVFPDEVVSTANGKALAGCPTPSDPELAEICDLPDMFPAEPVPTSVAIGPDGAFYVGELKGFPAPIGESRVWRIERHARNAKCGTSPKCKVVFDGFTSIIDLTFGPDGRLNIAQIDDASWFAAETGAGVGGSVHACSLKTKACEEVVSGVPILTSIAYRCDGDGQEPGANQRFGFHPHKSSHDGCDGDDDCARFAMHGGRGGRWDDDDKCQGNPDDFALWGATWSLVPGQADVVPLKP